MNKHMLNWLQAYHDNELSAQRRKQVEAHLEDCPECIQELEALQVFSSLLADSPAPQTHTRPNQFVAQVKLQLPSQNQRSFWQRTGRTIWVQVPVLLLFVLLVMQINTITNNVFYGIQRFGVGGEETNSLLTSELGLNIPVELPSLEIADWARVAIRSLGVGSFFGVSMFNRWIFPAVLGLLYVVWIASWWLRDENGDRVAS